MDGLALALVYAGAAGLMIPAGALLARVERIRPYWLETEFRHSVIAFGGGVLLGAVAFVLVPEGTARLPSGWAVAAFLAGGVLFAAIDRAMERRRTRGVQALAMATDYLPEAAALGAILAAETEVAGLLAFLIGLQNLPEAFNAWRELAATPGARPARLAWLFAGLAALGPAAAAAGYLVLSGAPQALGAIMQVAAGGIVFLVFQDIAVQAHLARRQVPALGAVAGFALALLGHLLVG